MDLQTRTLNFIQELLRVNNEELISRLESILKKEKENLEPVLKNKLTSRALRANEDIREGKVYNRKEAETNLKKRMDI